MKALDQNIIKGFKDFASQKDLKIFINKEVLYLQS